MLWAVLLLCDAAAGAADATISQNKTSARWLCLQGRNVFVPAQILAFPCNQFGGLEPGSNADIKAAVRNTYNATFPLFSKVATSCILRSMLIRSVVLHKMGPLRSAAACLTMGCAGGCEWAECTPSVALPAGPPARQPRVPNHHRLEL